MIAIDKKWDIDGPIWIGLDVHKRTCTATALDENGDEIKVWTFSTVPDELDSLARGLPAQAMIALEASTSGKAVFRQIQEHGGDVHMASPRQLRAITSSDVKTDRRDSYHLANLLRNNYFPECYVPPVDVDHLRTLVRFRMGLGQQVSGVKNQVHALVARNLLSHVMDQHSDWFGKAGLQTLASLPLSERDRSILHAYLEHLLMLVNQQEQVRREMARMGQESEDVQLLMTIPGFDYYNALGVLAEIGDVTRFENKKKLYSYAGLVPKADNSGEKTSKHRRVKRGNPVLKYFLGTAMQAATRTHQTNSVQKFYKKKAKQIGGPKARIAATRKMAGIVWKILITRESYEEPNEQLLDRKKVRMARKASKPFTPVSEEDLSRMATMLGDKEDVLRSLAPQEEPS